MLQSGFEHKWQFNTIEGGRKLCTDQTVNTEVIIRGGYQLLSKATC